MADRQYGEAAKLAAAAREALPADSAEACLLSLVEDVALQLDAKIPKPGAFEKACPGEDEQLRLERLISLGSLRRVAGEAKLSAEAYAAARELATRLRTEEALSRIDRGEAVAAVTRNDFDAADQLLAAAWKHSAAPGLDRERILVRMAIGYRLLKEGRYDEGIPHFRAATVALEPAGPSNNLAIASGNLGICLYQIGDFDGGMRALERARDIQRANGARPSEGRWIGEIANLQSWIGRSEEAIGNYRAALEIAREVNNPIDAGRQSSNLAQALILAGDWDSAEEMNRLSRELRKNEKSDQPALYARSNEAQILAGRGRWEEAEKVFLELLLASTKYETLAWSVRADLAELYSARGRVQEAKRYYQDALSRVEASRTDLADDQFKITFLARLIRLYRNYVSLLVREGKVDEALAAAESSRGRMIADRLNRPAAVHRRSLGYHALAARAGAVLMSFWTAPEESLLWVVKPDGTTLLKLPGSDVLGPLVDSHRQALLALRDPIRSDLAASKRLSELILTPVAGLIPAGSRVIATLDGPIHGLNLETLPVAGADGGSHFWIEDVTVSVAPGLDALENTAWRGGSRNALLVGDPEPVEGFPRLAHAAHELDEVARRLPADGLRQLRGKQATLAAYRGAEPGSFGLIHFAAHAEAKAERPLDAAVVLSGGDDAKLYVREVMRGKLNAEVVTLSACRTAGARSYPGEGLIGLAWGFLLAGSGNVLAGLWDVSDNSTALLMADFYEQLSAGAPPSVALRHAKLELLRSGGNFSKPYYWAPFQLYQRLVRPVTSGSGSAFAKNWRRQ